MLNLIAIIALQSERGTKHYQNTHLKKIQGVIMVSLVHSA